jgi:tetratricopeptide (TPR) repeat protein
VLARIHNHLGAIFTQLEQLREAEPHLRGALKIHEQLAAEFPTVPEYRGDLAMTHNNLGLLLDRMGDGPGAEEQFQKSLTIHEKLAAEFKSPAYVWEVARSCHNMVNLLTKLDRAPDAEAFDRKAMTIYEKLAADFPNMPVYRRDLATSYNNFGSVLFERKEFSEAEDFYRRARAIQEKLISEFPDSPEYRGDLARSHNNLGALLVETEKTPEADKEYRAAIAIREKLFADSPAAPGVRADLGFSYGRMGNFIRDGDAPVDSLPWFEKAIVVLSSADERDVQSRQYLRDAYVSRAEAYTRLAWFDDAMNDWHQAVERSPNHEKPVIRSERAKSLTSAGREAEAAAELDELTKTTTWSPEQLYDFARIYAAASAKIADQEQEYADRAMEILASAVEAGFNDAVYLAKDTGLDQLRERDDFKRLVSKLAGKKDSK